MRILVTGVSGFVGAMLAPRLLADGHRVRALSRDPQRAAAALADGLEAPAHDLTESDPHDLTESDPLRASEIVQGDVLTGAGLKRALDGIEVAYYLVHSMESPRAGATFGQGFPERERLGAQNFADAAHRAGVRRIVYLGGLVPRSSTPVSTHLASREAVEEILLEAIPDSVALRSSIVIGARSRSFRMLVRLIERMPVLTLPPWRRFRTQPIDARDAIELLVAAADARAVAGRSLDIGGPEALTYEQLLTRIADSLLLSRPTFALGIGVTPLTARLAAAISREDPELTVALMEGLRSDLLPAEDRTAELLGVPLHSLDAAIECALRDWEAVEPLAAR
ncbi:MAG TPA: NAD-dependent epimerase/dehydratase family protein [Solirubrobacteraceae bacterium]